MSPPFAAVPSQEPPSALSSLSYLLSCLLACRNTWENSEPGMEHIHLGLWGRGWQRLLLSSWHAKGKTPLLNRQQLPGEKSLWGLSLSSPAFLWHAVFLLLCLARCTSLCTHAANTASMLPFSQPIQNICAFVDHIKAHITGSSHSCMLFLALFSVLLARTFKHLRGGTKRKTGRKASDRT